MDNITVEFIKKFEEELHLFVNKSELFEENLRNLKYNYDKILLDNFLKSYNIFFTNKYNVL